MRSIANQPRFRPPAEADSLILQVDVGCPHNACDFCGMYKGMSHRQRTSAEIDSLIDAALRSEPHARRVFLADGDAFRLPFDTLAHICDRLRAGLPQLARINCYATGRAIDGKTDAELADLRARGLHTLYVGLESGDEALLEAMHKGESAALMVRGGQRAAAAGLRLSVMVLLGLGGAEGSARHAADTAAALNAMQPALLSLLRVIPVPGTPLGRRHQAGAFAMLSEHACVAETRALLSRLSLRQTVLRANHSSNLVPLEGRLPRDQARLLAALDALLAGGRLDRRGPGPMPLFL